MLQGCSVLLRQDAPWSGPTNKGASSLVAIFDRERDLSGAEERRRTSAHVDGDVRAHDVRDLRMGGAADTPPPRVGKKRKQPA